MHHVLALHHNSKGMLWAFLTYEKGGNLTRPQAAENRRDERKGNSTP